MTALISLQDHLLSAAIVKQQLSVDIANNHLTSVSLNSIISLINCFKIEKITLCNNSNDYEELDNKLFESSIFKTRIVKIASCRKNQKL